MSTDKLPNWPDFVQEFAIEPSLGYDRNPYPDWDRPTYKRMVRNHASGFFISKTPGMPGKTYRKKKR